MRAYNTKQVAEMFGVSRETVERWIRTGRLTAAKMSGSYVITEEAVIEFQTGEKYCADEDREYAAEINALLFGAKEEKIEKPCGMGNPDAPHKKITLTVSENEDIRK